MTHLVTFPGLGLELELNRVAIELFGFPIYWYGAIIAMGFLVAALVCYKIAPKFGVNPDTFYDAVFFTVPLGVIGARIYYVIFYLDLYRNPDGGFFWGEMLDIRDGGLAIYGGIIMGAIVLLTFCKVKKLPFLAFGDVLIIGVIIGQIAGRWGNFVNVEAFGGETTLPWRMGIETYINGVVTYMEVHPTFLYESLWNLLGLGVLFLVARKWRKFDGQLVFTYFLWYGIGRGVIEGLRTDSLYFFQTGLRVSQVFGFATAAISLALLCYMLCVKKPDPAQLYLNRQKCNGSQVHTTEEDVSCQQ